MSKELWSVIAVTSFWCWVACVLLFIWKSFPRLGVFQSRPAMIWGGASVVSAGVWMLALRLA